MGECSTIAKHCEHDEAKECNTSPKSLVLREAKPIKTIFGKGIEAMATSSEEKTTINGVCNNPLLQQSCASLKKGSRKMTPTSETTLALGGPSKQAYKHKRKPKRHVQRRATML